ncbi:MAG TPA: L,D-transpeptidase family protein, partial [Pyrinomonadaceae bacterium]|nr:L,D-transpeptidase family protein [Pyrinomonadaceae bacterium]
MKRLFGQMLSLAACLAALGCVAEPAANKSTANSNASPAASATVSPAPVVETKAPAQPLTLPVLDAFLADNPSSELLKTRLQLSADQVTKLKEMAHAETAKLNDASAGNGEGQSAEARTQAEEKITALIGAEKTSQLAALVGEWWSSSPNDTTTSAKQDNRDQLSTEPNAVPTDSRIVVNAPAYRMDVFDGGRLIKSYKIGIGYPQFPLPTGLRKAREIIFNPTWTPPDEPWVAKMKDVTVGEKVEAGSKLNPLGPIKIPIGGPSLIHGGKSPAKLGTFASHGCVGLTTPQVQDFAKVLAQLAGGQLSDANLAAYGRDKTKTRYVKLDQPVPVELRYETMVVEDGKLHIYRDVYDRGTNTEENLRDVLTANSVRLEDLSEEERTQISNALAQLSGKSAARTGSLSKEKSPVPSPSGSPPLADKKPTAARANRIGKNQKEVV